MNFSMNFIAVGAVSCGKYLLPRGNWLKSHCLQTAVKAHAEGQYASIGTPPLLSVTGSFTNAWLSTLAFGTAELFGGTCTSYAVAGAALCKSLGRS